MLGPHGPWDSLGSVWWVPLDQLEEPTRVGSCEEAVEVKAGGAALLECLGLFGNI